MKVKFQRRYQKAVEPKGTNSTDYLPLRQMPVAYNQLLFILVTAILVD